MESKESGSSVLTDVDFAFVVDNGMSLYQFTFHFFTTLVFLYVSVSRNAFFVIDRLLRERSVQISF